MTPDTLPKNENFTWKRRLLIEPFFRTFQRPLRKFMEVPGLNSFIRANRACPRFRDKLSLHAFIAERYCQSGVDYLEFGVAAGGTFRHWLQIDASPNSRFFGFDSFEGLPEDFVEGAPKGTFDCGGRPPEVDDPRARFVVGRFQNTVKPFLRDFEPRNRLVVHCDADLYSSTLFVLAAIDHVVKSGSILIFDEFTALVHEFRAFHDYLCSHDRRAQAVAATPSFGQVAFILE